MMRNLRLVFVFFLLLTGSNTGYGFPLVNPENFSIEEKTPQFSEDFQKLPPSRLSISSTDYFKYRTNLFLTTIPVKENARDYSRTTAYFLANQFIEPGLSLSDIIFPFHIFL